MNITNFPVQRYIHAIVQLLNVSPARIMNIAQRYVNRNHKGAENAWKFMIHQLPAETKFEFIIKLRIIKLYQKDGLYIASNNMSKNKW